MPIRREEYKLPEQPSPECLVVYIRDRSSSTWEDRKFSPDYIEKTFGDIYKEIITTAGSPVIDAIKKLENQHKGTDNPPMIFPHRGQQHICRGRRKRPVMFPLDSNEPIKEYIQQKLTEQSGVRTTYMELSMEIAPKAHCDTEKRR